MLPDLVVVLAQGALEHDLLRTSAALLGITNLAHRDVFATP